jgi:hypothetical protein
VASIVHGAVQLAPLIFAGAGVAILTACLCVWARGKLRQRRIERKTSTESLPGPELGVDLGPGLDHSNPDGGPVFRIVSLGLSGSGKTVFLSALFHALNHPVKQRPYFLTAGVEDRLRLLQLYDEVADPDGPWPIGTRVEELRTFEFGVDCGPENARRKMMRIRYVDYGGELLVPKGLSYRQLSELDEQVNGAHALLGMINGYRVLQLLKNDLGADRHFDRELQPLVGYLNAASCPVHLVVTKWDIVRDFGEPPKATDEERLRCVADALMRYEHIAALARSRRDPPVRLLPVSAVGDDFVTEVDAKGVSLKRPGARVYPANVDVPLCAILPDLFTSVESKLEEEARRQLVTAMRWRRAGEILNDEGFLGLLREFLPRPVVASAQWFVAWMNQRGRNPLPGGEDGDPDQRAREEVMRHFVTRTYDFEDELPSSNLSARRR